METLKRALVTFAISIAFFAAAGLIQRPIAQGAPAMTSPPAPVTRVAPTAEKIARATPSPQPGPRIQGSRAVSRSSSMLPVWAQPH